MPGGGVMAGPRLHHQGRRSAGNRADGRRYPARPEGLPGRQARLLQRSAACLPPGRGSGLMAARPGLLRRARPPQPVRTSVVRLMTSATAATLRDRLLPTMLPSHWTRLDTHGQAWNISPADGHCWTVLDDLPTTTDQKVGGSSSSERARPQATSDRGMAFTVAAIAAEIAHFTLRTARRWRVGRRLAKHREADGGVSRQQRLVCRLSERALPPRVDGRHRLDAPLPCRALTCNVAVHRVGN